MARIRAFEETALEAHRAGEIPGPLHVSIGQEAVAAGICLNLRKDDRITSNHRGHGHAIAKGAEPKRMMLELYGREGGYCRGKGGSMHIADFSVGMLGANGVVAGGIPIAVGAAQGLKMQGSDAIVTCMFGDGAVNRGPFLEGLNWAVLFKLPVLFVCEDNGVAAFTRAESVTAGPGVIDRAKALGVAAITIDGNSVMAVDDAAATAVAAVRRGEARTFSTCAPTASPATPRPTRRHGGRRKRWMRRARAIRSRGSVLCCRARGGAKRAWQDHRGREGRDGRSAQGSECGGVACAGGCVRGCAGYGGGCVVEVTLIEASRRAALQEMRRDERVWVLGEDVARGGLWGQYKDFLGEFGDQRVVSTPISESTIMGAGLGSALVGQRPIIEMRIFDFVMCAMDELVNQIAKIR